MSKKRISITIVCLWIITWWIIDYPVQGNFAEKEIYKYMQKQGITEKNIKSEISFKNELFDGYCIEIRLKDDAKFEYRYEYLPRKGLLNFKQYKIELTVYDDNGDCYEVGNKKIPKYLPLKNE